MTYAQLVTLYPYLNRIMDKISRSLAAGLEPTVMLGWAVGELEQIKNAPHRNAATTKVMMLIDAIMGGTNL